jgi:hypothetical protein
MTLLERHYREGILAICENESFRPSLMVSGQFHIYTPFILYYKKKHRKKEKQLQ